MTLMNEAKLPTLKEKLLAEESARLEKMEEEAKAKEVEKKKKLKK